MVSIPSKLNVTLPAGPLQSQVYLGVRSHRFGNNDGNHNPRLAALTGIRVKFSLIEQASIEPQTDLVTTQVKNAGGKP